MRKVIYTTGLTVIAAVLILTTSRVMAEKPKNETIKRAVLRVENLTCGGCFYTINEGLAPLDGYSGMGSNLWRKLVAVDFVEPLTPEKIARTITDSGYPARATHSVSTP